MIQTQRKAFSMITALFIIVMMSSVGAMVFSISGKTIKSTTNQYQRVQAVLLAKSYTELAIMAVTANDRNASQCVETINGAFAGGIANNGYDAVVEISYIGNAAQQGNCVRWANTTDETLNIIVDTYISYADLDDDPVAPRTSTYHRRTLQKI